MIHLLKPALGCASPREIYERQQPRAFRFEGQEAVWAYTKRKPVREAELLAGGALYWVIQNRIACRQSFIGLGEGLFDDGSPYTKLILTSEIVLTHPLPYKSFQGWRYLKPENAPADLYAFDPVAEEPPEEMAAELKSLGLL